MRPEVQLLLRRWAETAAAGVAVGAGLWLASLGGYFFVPLGGLAALVALGWALIALRRARFTRTADAPGLVEVDEGQLGYLGPAFGGFVALDDIEELRLVTVGGQRLWRLRQADGQALMIPVGAEGAERLFDAFASLPGMDLQALVAAVSDKPLPGSAVISLSSEAARIGPVIWRRRSRAVLT